MMLTHFRASSRMFVLSSNLKCKGNKRKVDDVHNHHTVPMDTLLKYSCLFVNHISPPKAQNYMM